MISLTPKSTQFFDLLEEQAQHLAAIADALESTSAGRMRQAEAATLVINRRNASDTVFDRYVEELHAAFVTPIDRDDLYHLGFGLEQLICLIERLTDRWNAFDIPATEPNQAQLTAFLVKACREIIQALPLFRRRSSMSRVPQHFRALRQIERDAEQVYRRGLKELTDTVSDARKWVQLKEGLDIATDALRHAKTLADTFHKVVIRNV
jgi:uncharacterized protein Yka (UPF0111/DUF47 family)